MHHRRPSVASRATSARLARPWILLALVSLIAMPHAGSAAPVLGFVEEWSGTSLSGWGVGGTPASNPGTGGLLGPGDGFLKLSSSVVFNYGTFSSGPEYAGNWTAAGITQVRVWLSDLGTDDPLEIHFGLGRDVHSLSPNFWVYNIGVIPPVNAWQEYVVDLTAPADWTQTFGTGTLADALAACEKIHLRHDVPPITPSPEGAMGDLGIDHLVLASPAILDVASDPPAAGARRVAVARPVSLAPPAPNPSRGPVALALETFVAGPVHVEIVDASGRRVRRVELAEGPAGPRSWTWDGTDERGRRAAPGYYRARAWNAAGGTSRPLIRTP
jgi:flagellar hook capping protein FlgD